MKIPHALLVDVFADAAAQEKHQAASSTLDQLKLGVDALFAKIKCDKARGANDSGVMHHAAQAEIVGQLGNATIGDANIMQYLGIIEHRTNELLQLQTLIDIQARPASPPHGLQTFIAGNAKVGEAGGGAARQSGRGRGGGHGRHTGGQYDRRCYGNASGQGPKPRATGLLGVGPQPSASGINIQPPSTEADYDSDDNADEVACRLLQSMN